MKRMLSLLAFTILAACGSDGAGWQPGSLRGLVGSLGNRAAPPDLRQSLTPEVIAGFEGPLLFVEVLDNSIQAGLVPGPRNGSVQQWNTVDGTSLSLDDGLLVASRGLGGDLMSADVLDVRAALKRGGGTAERVHRTLTHDNQLHIQAFRCSYSDRGPEAARTLAGTFPARRIDEDCHDSAGLHVENSYWIDGSGTIRASRQWLSPLAGYLAIERLKDR